MRAALVTSEGKLDVSEVPSPEPGEGEAVVNVSYCGICGSDIHMLEAGMLPPGSIMGHELSGHVASIGSGAHGFSVGDPVAVYPVDLCLRCEPCMSGNTQLCVEGLQRTYGVGVNPGGFAQNILVKSSTLFRLPDGLDMRTAALNEPWAVAVHAVNMLDLEPDSVVLVMGAGPIGLMCIYALKVAGLSEIYVSEPTERRAEKARAAGAKGVIDPSSNHPSDVVLKSTGRLPRCVIDCVGTKTSTRDASAFVAPRGVVVVLGAHFGTAELDPLTCLVKEARLYFSVAYTYREFGECIGPLASGAVDPGVLVSAVKPLSEIGEAFEELMRFDHVKVLIDCQK